jgi:hypothetical protein
MRTRWKKLVVAMIGLVTLAGCWISSNSFAPTNSAVVILVDGIPVDSGIFVTTFIQNIQSPINRQTAQLPIGGSVHYSNLGAGFDIEVGVDTLSLSTHRCRIDHIRWRVQLSSAVKVQVTTRAGVTDTVWISLECRSADVTLNVSGLPAGDSADITIDDRPAPRMLRMTNGMVQLALVPDSTLSIFPDAVVGRDGRAYTANNQTVAAPSRHSTQVSVQYSALLPSCRREQPNAWYALDGSAMDVSGNGQHGTVFGATAAADRRGATGAALAFDGTDDAIDLGNRFDSLTVPFSIAAWVYQPAAASGEFRSIFASDDQPGSYYGIWFMISPTGHLSISYGDGGGTSSQFRRTAETVAPVLTDRWIHFAATVRGPTDMTLYVNGVPISTTFSGSGGAMLHSPAPARIGSFQLISANRPWLGSLDDVRLYGCSLDHAEVAFLAQP